MSAKTIEKIKSTRLKRVVMRKGTVLGIETLHDVWVLAQVVGRTEIAFFDAFAKRCSFKQEDWDSAELLFVNSVTQQFLRNSKVHKMDLSPKENIAVPDEWINRSLFGKFSRVVLWEGTSHERRLLVKYGGSLVRNVDDVLIERIRINDRKTIDNHELSGLATFPYMNHRLYLCFKLKRNADPLKELAFRRPLPTEYQEVIDRLYPEDHF